MTVDLETIREFRSYTRQMFIKGRVSVHYFYEAINQNLTKI